ncbi:MAG: hypothetical protein FWE45_00525 [Firmicutes bacterium]|nr:hypothetical protein [Bacillota bacterium]
MTEEEIYLGTKIGLLKRGFKIMAGQPPRGTDSLPVIEIKSGEHTNKGSYRSYKPDLVCYDGINIYIIECKPNYNYPDVCKLLSVKNSPLRISMFYNELEKRGLFEKFNIPAAPNTFADLLKFCIAYSGTKVENPDVDHIIVSDMQGDIAIG